MYKVNIGFSNVNIQENLDIGTGARGIDCGVAEQVEGGTLRWSWDVIIINEDDSEERMGKI